MGNSLDSSGWEGGVGQDQRNGMHSVRLAVPVIDGTKALLHVLECSLVIMNRGSADDRDSSQGQSGDKPSTHLERRVVDEGWVSWWWEKRRQR